MSQPRVDCYACVPACEYIPENLEHDLLFENDAEYVTWVEAKRNKRGAKPAVAP